GPSAQAVRRGASANPQSPGGQDRRGFQNLNLNDTAETPENPALDAALRPPDVGAPGENAANANEAFLVNGSLSTGLDAPGQQGPFFPRGGEGFAFQQGFGDPNNPGGPGLAGGPGGDGQAGGPPGPG